MASLTLVGFLTIMDAVSTVAVTGASGHLGANLVRALLAEGHRVRALVHRQTRAIEGLAIERVSGDVLDRSSLAELCCGAELVYHLAAVISIDGAQRGWVERVNVEGTENVVAAARAAGVKRLVHTSSIHAFDLTAGGSGVDETSPRSDTPRHFAYERSKAAGEQTVRRARGLDAVILNPTAVLGPHDYQPSRMARFFLALYWRKLWALVEGGFDWVDVRDVVTGMLAAARLGRAGESYILSGHWCSLRDLARQAETTIGVPLPRFTAPRWLAAAGAPFAVTLAHRLGREPLFTAESLRTLQPAPFVRHDKASRDLGYEPRPLPVTIEAVYRWLAEDGLIPRTASVHSRQA